MKVTWPPVPHGMRRETGRPPARLARSTTAPRPESNGKTGTLTCEPDRVTLIVRKYENYGPVAEVDIPHDRQRHGNPAGRPRTAPVGLHDRRGRLVRGLPGRGRGAGRRA